MRILAVFILSAGLLGSPLCFSQNVFIVDKAKYTLQIVDPDNNYQALKSYPVTIGKVSGDKTVEGDQKTPEGIYFFTAKYRPPQIKAKFGAMAFYISYPNLMDKAQGKTGFDIMLHSTNDPKRLENSQDSDGCVVVNDEQIQDIEPYVIPEKSVIMIYDALKPEYLTAGYYQDIKTVYEKWLEAWNNKDLEAYIGFYSDSFSSKGMNKAQYREYKNTLNNKYHTINVKVSNVRFYKHPKYSLITYRQEYLATYKDGRTAFNVSSNKSLYLSPEADGHKIVYEGN